MATDSPFRYLIDAELAAGNTVVRQWQDECDREVVHVARPFHHEWRRGLDARETVWRLEHEMRQTSQDDFEYHDWEKIENIEFLVFAPTPTAQQRAERIERDRAAGRLLPEAQALPEHRLPRKLLLARCADRIEHDLRTAKEWRDDLSAAPPFRAAFGADVMPFSNWLQLVFLPRLRTIAATNGKLPAPGAAAYAVREFDGRDDLAKLCSRLAWIDGIASLDQPERRAARGDFRFLGVATAYTLVIALVAVVALALGGELADRIDVRDPNESRGSVTAFVVRGLRSAPDSKLELRVHGRGDLDGLANVSTLELVQLSKPRFTGVTPGLIPLTIECDDLLAAPKIQNWLVVRDADSALALDDANALFAYATTLASAPTVRDATALLPSSLVLDAPASVTSHEIAPPAGARLAIQFGTLLALLLPAAWFAIRVAKRVLRRA
jgi:uncharacterized protein YqcC (DUF446 family)